MQQQTQQPMQTQQVMQTQQPMQMQTQQPMQMQMQPQAVDQFGNPVQVVVVQQQPMQTGTGTNYASKQDAIRVEYAKTEQICPLGTFMIWAMVMWCIILVGVVIWCIFGLVIIGIAASCVVSDHGSADDLADALCTVGIALGVVILILGGYELCVVSLIVHGIRNYQHGLCIFGCVWAGIGLLGSWAVVGAVAYVSVTSFVLWGLTLVFTAFHTHYVGKAQQVWYAQNASR
eukprot:109984_1